MHHCMLSTNLCSPWPKAQTPQLYFCGVAITDSVRLTQCMDDTPLKPPCTRRALLAQANTPWLQQPVDSCIVREHDTAALHDAAHGRGHAMGQVCVHALAVRLEMSSLVGSRYSSSADGFIACIHSTQHIACYTGKATKASNRHGRQKPNYRKHSYNQPKRPSTGTTHRSHTGVHRKTKPRVELHTLTEHTPAQQPCTHVKCIWHTPRRTGKVIVRILVVNTTQCASQAGRAALLHVHHPRPLRHAASPSRGAAINTCAVSAIIRQESMHGMRYYSVVGLLQGKVLRGSLNRAGRQKFMNTKTGKYAVPRWASGPAPQTYTCMYAWYKLGTRLVQVWYKLAIGAWCMSSMSWNHRCYTEKATTNVFCVPRRCQAFGASSVLHGESDERHGIDTEGTKHDRHSTKHDTPKSNN